MSNETIGVKLSYDGQLRRFPLAKGTTYAALRDQVITLLELQKNADIVLKYTDEEGDLITISSDLELSSAFVAGQLLRLVVFERKNSTEPKDASVPVVTPATVAPSVAAAASVAAPQGPACFKAFGRGCGGGHARGAAHGFGRGGHGRRDLSPEEWEKFKEERIKAREASGFGGCGGRGRRDLSPEEWEKFREERRKVREGMGARGGFGGRGGRWGRGCGGEGHAPVDPKDRLVAKFAKDVTIEDGATLAAGTPFVKTWRLRNDGAEWPAGCVLRFLGKHGDNMGGPETAPLSVTGPVAPNTEVEVSVNLVAPEKPGRYAGYYRMSTPEGRKFGQRVWVSIVVPSHSSSSEEDKEADKYEALVGAVLARGVTVKRHRIFRLLQKFDGNVDLVCERLAVKAQRREARFARRAANANVAN